MIYILLSSILFLLVVLCNLTAISIFLRCRLMMKQMRMILLAHSQQAVVYSILAALACIIKMDHENAANFSCLLYQTVVSMGVVTPVVLSTYMSLDKYMSLVWPFWHARVITPKLTIKIITALVVSLFSLGCVFLVYVYLTSDTSEEKDCYTPQHIQVDIIFEVVILTFCIVLGIRSWIGIICHTKKYTNKVIPRANSRENISRYVETFQMLILIFTVNFVQNAIVIPIYIVDIMRVIQMENTDHLIMVDRKLRIGFFVTILINPIIYIFKFRECHYHVLKLFCCCVYKLQEKAERLESAFRLEHARIPTPVIAPVQSLDRGFPLPKTPQKNLFAIQIPDIEQHKWSQKNYNAIHLFVVSKSRQDIP